MPPILADTTNLDLMELDRYWDCLLEGRPQDYHGNAVNPNNLSTWERWLGRGKHFDMAKDAQDRKVRREGDLPLHSNHHMRPPVPRVQGFSGPSDGEDRASLRVN